MEAFAKNIQKGNKMSIKATGIRLSDTNKTRMKNLLPQKSFNDIVEHLLDQAEKPTDGLSDDTRKALCKKFDLDYGTALEDIVGDYLIHDRQQRIDAISKIGNAAVLLELYGDEDDVLNTIETTYLPIINSITNDGGMVTLGSLTKALRVAALIITGERLKGLKNG